MSKKVWVRVFNNDYGSRGEREWKLGTVVGEQILRYTDTSSLKGMLKGEHDARRYLVELDDGQVEEAWIWDVFEPTTGNDLVATDPDKDTKAVKSAKSGKVL